MGKKLIVVLLVLTPLLYFAQSEDENNISSIIVALLHEKASVLQNFKAEVQLATYSEIFVQVLTTDYKMYYSKPGYFRMDKLAGDREVLVVNGDDVLHSTNGAALTKSYNKRIAGVVNSLISQLISASYVDDNTFAVIYSEEPRGYSVILKPKRNLLSRNIERIELMLNKKDVSILEIKLYQSEFEYFIYSFTSVDYNSEIDLKIFSVL